MDAEEQFLRHIALIDRICAFIARRNHLGTDEAKDFAADVKLALIDGNYAVIRKFEGRSSFSTYLTTVIQRLFYQHRVEQWGKWRPSAEAKRLGDKAITVERLLTRDGMSIGEVTQILTTRADALYTVKEIEQIYRRLPERHPRPVLVAEEHCIDAVAQDDEADARLQSVDRAKTGRTACAALDRVLETMAEEDQLILRMRFWAGRKVPDIAAALHLDQKKVYKRIDKMLANLRSALEREGIDRTAIAELLTRGDDEMTVHMGDAVGNRAAGPSHGPDGEIGEDGGSRRSG